MLTGFVRIIIAMHFVRAAMGAQQMPPNQVLIGLALFLTFLIMFPTFTEIKETAWDPYEAGEITDLQEVAELTMVPLKDFMIRQIRHHDNEGDLVTFWRLAGNEEVPDEYEDYPLRVVIPAFMVSEIKVAFMTGFMIFIPFIVIDMVVASILMSMGMMMLPPIMISLPFKIMFFMLVDGWGMTIQGLIIEPFIR
jgi:flagellar biosynthetic protein FliP